MHPREAFWALVFLGVPQGRPVRFRLPSRIATGFVGLAMPWHLPPMAFEAAVWDEPNTGIGLYTRCLASGLEAAGATLSRLIHART